MDEEVTHVFVMPLEEVPNTIPFAKDIEHLDALNVGCGYSPFEGWINADVQQTEYCNAVFNAQKKWPYEDHFFKVIVANHVIEHLDDLNMFFNEAHRCLHPLGSMVLRFPHPRHTHSMGDPDHRRVIPEHYFYWLGMKGDQCGGPHHKNKSPTWSMRLLVHGYDKKSFLHKWYMTSKMRHLAVEHLWNICIDMAVWLKPVVYEKGATAHDT